MILDLKSKSQVIVFGRGIGKTLLYIVLICFGITMIFPFLWMVSTSLKQNQSIFEYPPTLIPREPTTTFYTYVFTRYPTLAAFINSIKIAGINTIGILLSASMAAYGFAKLRFKGKNVLFMILLATMMIPNQVTLIPMFIWFRTLGWIDTHLPLIIPVVLCNAYGVFLLRQFMMTIPDSLSESAKIDGASQLIIFFRIILPLCIPALATLGLFSFMGSWNSFLVPLIYLNTEKKYTIPLIIMSFKNQYYSDWGLMMAAASVSIVPVIIIYIFAQRFFIEGVVLSGIKG